MFNVLLAVHLLLAVFVVGPLVQAATTAGRGVRRAEAAATASAARLLRIYGIGSVLVVVAGFGLMSMDDPDRPGRKVAAFGQTWVWLSVVLWLVAVGVVLAVLVPALTSATARIGAGTAVDGLTARLGAGGGVVGLLFAVIVVLMVYRPGGS